MNYRRILSLVIFCSGLFYACSSTGIDESTLSLLDVITLQITPELEAWMPKISQCAAPIPSIGIYTQVLTQEELSLDKADLVLKLGPREPDDPYIAVMGVEEIVVIGGNEIPTDRISIGTLQSIFSGAFRNWADLPEINETATKNQPIKTYTYPEDHILNDLFSTSFLEGEAIYSEAIYFASPNGLQRAFQEHPYGIGYLLKSQVPVEMNILEITGVDEVAALQYVLAVTLEEPTGTVKQLLLCLQTSP